MDKVLQESHDTPPPSHKAKLANIHVYLPQFSGNRLKWSSFWDSFNSAVHNSPELSEAEKFNYLHSLLEDASHDPIHVHVAGMTLSSTNYMYKEAVEILKSNSFTSK